MHGSSLRAPRRQATDPRRGERDAVDDLVDVDHCRVRRAGLAVATAEKGMARAGKEEGRRWWNTVKVGPRRGRRAGDVGDEREKRSGRQRVKEGRRRMEEDKLAIDLWTNRKK